MKMFNPLNTELNPICHLLELLGGATIVVVSRLRIKDLNIIYIIIAIHYLNPNHIWVIYYWNCKQT
jgi:hypothetical protein